MILDCEPFFGEWLSVGHFLHGIIDIFCYTFFVTWLTNYTLGMERRLSTPEVEPRTPSSHGLPRSLAHHLNLLIAMDSPRPSRTTSSSLLISERVRVPFTLRLISHMPSLRIKLLSLTLRMRLAPRPRELRDQPLFSSESSRLPRTSTRVSQIRIPLKSSSSHLWYQPFLSSPRMRSRLSSDNNKPPSFCSDLNPTRMPLS